MQLHYQNSAENYFGKHAAELDLEEAAFIAGLPQAPNYYGYDLQAGRQRQREDAEHPAL